MAMDRYLYLWQVAAQDHAYAGSNNYKPFPKSASCGGNLASCKMKCVLLLRVANTAAGRQIKCAVSNNGRTDIGLLGHTMPPSTNQPS